jgi:hypothetical protein
METVHSRGARALAQAAMAPLAPAAQVAMAPPGGLRALRAEVAGAQAAGRSP